jgi:hypothetical protein
VGAFSVKGHKAQHQRTVFIPFVGAIFSAAPPALKRNGMPKVNTQAHRQAMLRRTMYQCVEPLRVALVTTLRQPGPHSLVP